MKFALVMYDELQIYDGMYIGRPQCFRTLFVHQRSEATYGFNSLYVIAYYTSNIHCANLSGPFNNP